jgi:transcription-repair coupling factor (superfamily II helicase)
VDPTGRAEHDLDLGTVGPALGALLGRKRSVRVGGAHGGSSGLFLASLAAGAPALLVVLHDPHARDALRIDLDTFLREPSLPFPLWPRDLGGTPPDPEVLAGRTVVLERLRLLRAGGAAAAPLVIATTLAALAQDVPAAAVLDAAAFSIASGAERPLHGLLEHLALSGYARVPAVETAGEFAARGGVVDVWPLGRPTPVRMDYFGDVVEAVRELDPGTQRSGDTLPRVDLLAIPPERLRSPDPGGASSLVAHLPPGSRVALVEPRSLVEAAAGLRQEAGGDRRVPRLERELAALPVLELSQGLLGDEGDLDLDVGTVDSVRGIALAPIERRGPGAAPPEDRTLKIAEAFRALARRADRVVLYCRAEGEEERMRELFRAHDPGIPVRTRRGSLTRSFLFGPTRTAHVAYDDLADLAPRERRRAHAAPRGRPIQDFLELEAGAPVVHLHHGIGLYRGLVTLDGKDGPGEFLRVEFAEGTTVYVPVARIDLVQRYVGTGRPPRLSRLGGAEWAARRKRVEAAVADLAEELLEVQAARARRAGSPCPPDTEWQREFEDAFPHPLTPDQATAAAAVKRDLESGRPMDRLLCGDVGYGKTEVALRAVFKVVASGRQAAVLVPTKVLAEQHVRTFTQRLASYPVRVRALSGLHAARDNRETVRGLAEGTVDVVVGTHRLLSKDVSFRNLGLVVVDEEQRFGVKHKERLKALRTEVDVLTLSATPIPRTLHMALLGLRDISNLTTPPLGRHPVETRVSKERDDLVEEALRRELARGGQTFLVTSRIRDLPAVGSWVLRLVPELRLASIHGRMEKHLVEDRMLRFVRGEVDLLLATTIIESGLDIPNANTIVIRDADRYGLAELHQLRGRVGRERRRAHALILLPPRRPVRPEASERLRAIEEYSELGAGFRIAMRDLEIRGAGNLLGPQQSGHIAAVGYDLYCRLLADAVRRVKGEGAPPVALAYLAVDLPAGVPEAWVPDPREKFRLFRRVASVETLADLDALVAELRDRFGPVPADAERLLLAQRVRILAGALGFERVLPAEEPGVVVREGGGGGGIDRLARAGVDARRLAPDAAFLPTPGASSAEEILRRAAAMLERAAAPPRAARR